MNNNTTEPNHVPHGNSTQHMCITLPPQVNSAGVWENTKSPYVILDYTLPVLLLQMTLIFVVTQTSHFFLKRIGVLLFVSQMIAGLILGPHLVGLIDGLKDELFPPLSLEIIDTLAVFGQMMFLFLTGMKTNLGMTFRNRRQPVVIGIASILIPLAIGMAVRKSSLNPDSENPEGILLERFAVISVQSLTPFPVITSLLSELKILNSELGRLVLSSAIVSDLCGVFLMSFIALWRVWGKSSLVVAFTDAGALVGYIFVVVFIFRPMLNWVVRKTPEGKPVKNVYIYIIIMVVFASALYTNVFNQFVLLGPLIFGMAVPDGPPLGSTLEDKFDCFVKGVLLPVFVTTSAMRADVRTVIFELSEVKFNIDLVVLTSMAKLVATLIPSWYCQMPFNDALALALIMSCKGVVELTFYSVAKDNKIISDETFSVVTLYVLLNAAIVPIIVRSLYDSSRKYSSYENTNITHLKPNSELRILPCIHRPDNVPAVINLLDSLTSSTESPVVVYVLHLMELIGRASPVFISHQNQTRTKVKNSYFETVILAFNQYQQNNWSGFVSVNTFTAISPPDLMHEDICSLALDKLTSLIVLPFHRKWSVGGTIESDSHSIRNLNRSVLDRAPCSVGILVDRGQVARIALSRLSRGSSRGSAASWRSSCCVGMIFIGGKDDREALTLAKRMAKDPGVNLTVIHFVSEESTTSIDWDSMLDSEELKDVKKNNVDNGNLMYIEEVVKDGPQTALIVRSLVDGYDLFIVGRRLGVDSPGTSGLSEWSEFPELGIIGDLLASKDFDSKASVLVVQQQ